MWDDNQNADLIFISAANDRFREKSKSADRRKNTAHKKNARLRFCNNYWYPYYRKNETMHIYRSGVATIKRFEKSQAASAVRRKAKQDPTFFEGGTRALKNRIYDYTWHAS